VIISPRSASWKRREFDEHVRVGEHDRADRCEQALADRDRHHGQLQRREIRRADEPSIRRKRPKVCRSVVHDPRGGACGRERPRQRHGPVLRVGELRDVEPGGRRDLEADRVHRDTVAEPRSEVVRRERQRINAGREPDDQPVRVRGVRFRQRSVEILRRHGIVDFREPRDLCLRCRRCAQEKQCDPCRIYGPCSCPHDVSLRPECVRDRSESRAVKNFRVCLASGFMLRAAIAESVALWL